MIRSPPLPVLDPVVEVATEQARAPLGSRIRVVRVLRHDQSGVWPTRTVAHYHHERKHKGMGSVLLFPATTTAQSDGPITCRPQLGGLLKYYHRPAAYSARASVHGTHANARRRWRSSPDRPLHSFAVDRRAPMAWRDGHSKNGFGPPASVAVHWSRRSSSWTLRGSSRRSRSRSWRDASPPAPTTRRLRWSRWSTIRWPRPSDPHSW